MDSGIILINSLTYLSYTFSANIIQGTYYLKYFVQYFVQLFELIMDKHEHKLLDQQYKMSESEMCVFIKHFKRKVNGKPLRKYD